VDEARYLSTRRGGSWPGEAFLPQHIDTSHITHHTFPCHEGALLFPIALHSLSTLSQSTSISCFCYLQLPFQLMFKLPQNAIDISLAYFIIPLLFRSAVTRARRLGSHQDISGIAYLTTKVRPHINICAIAGAGGCRAEPGRVEW
jgi:hypothetical protein